MNLWKFIISTDHNDIILKTLFVLAAILAYLMIKNKRLFHSPNNSAEGFEQQDKFVSKCGANAIFDDFYADIYDKIFEPEVLAPLELKAILTTQPDKDNAIILDANSGTGHLVAALTKKGYARAFGVDASPEMVAKSREIFPNVKTKVANITEPMAFEPSTFTHVVLSNFAIYRYCPKNKRAILKNIATWLQPYGYFCLHLVDPDKFDPMVPAAKPLFGSAQPKSGRKYTDTLVNFDDFTYKSEFVVRKKPNESETMFRETFTDSASGNIRQHELEMWMDSPETIIKMAQQCGFSLIGKFDIKEWSRDDYQHIYVMQSGTYGLSVREP